MQKRIKDINISSQIIEIWQQIVDSISTLLCVPSVMINRIEPPELEVFCSNMSRDNPFPTGTSMQMLGIYCESTANKRQKVMVEDARTDPQWSDSPTAKAGINSYLGYPLFLPSGEVFGTLCAIDFKANKWLSPSDTLLQTVKNAIEAHLAMSFAMEELNKKNKELEISIKEIKTLQGLLPICASCKKIRDDKGYWTQLEDYIETHSGAQFSHGLCPECIKKLYPDIL